MGASVNGWDVRSISTRRRVPIRSPAFELSWRNSFRLRPLNYCSDHEPALLTQSLGKAMSLAALNWWNSSRHCRVAEMRCTTRLASARFDSNEEYAAFLGNIDADGAIVTFAGIARPVSTDGGEVKGLFLDHHPRLTEASLREIAEDAGQRFDVSAIHVVHRCGYVAPGDSIVFVAAAALHRRAAFEAAEYTMDRLKTEAVFWKREDAVDGSNWVEPTLIDQTDRARWSK